MRWISLLALVLVSCTITGYITSKSGYTELPKPVTVCTIQVDEAVWFREGPGTSYPASKTLGDGEVVEVLDWNGKWRYVRLASTESGWVHTRFVRCNESKR